MDKPPAIEQSERAAGLKQAIIDAVVSKDVERIVEALTAANQALTDRAHGHFSPGEGINDLKQEIETFLRQVETWGNASLVAYLGDGGFSRLAVRIERNGEIHVEPTSNSTENVKRGWERLA